MRTTWSLPAPVPPPDDFRGRPFAKPARLSSVFRLHAEQIHERLQPPDSRGKYPARYLSPALIGGSKRDLHLQLLARVSQIARPARAPADGRRQGTIAGGYSDCSTLAPAIEKMGTYR